MTDSDVWYDNDLFGIYDNNRLDPDYYSTDPDLEECPASKSSSGNAVQVQDTASGKKEDVQDRSTSSTSSKQVQIYNEMRKTK